MSFGRFTTLPFELAVEFRGFRFGDFFLVLPFVAGGAGGGAFSAPFLAFLKVTRRRRVGFGFLFPWDFSLLDNGSTISPGSISGLSSPLAPDDDSFS